MLIIQTTFMGRGQIRPEWRDKQKLLIRKRIQIFKKFTLKSLLGQTDKNFLHWICFRQEDVKNLDVQALKRYLDGIGYNYVFTFNKQPYWDDRGDNGDLKQRVSKDLGLLRGFIKEKVYMTVLDSDDCFQRKMVETIKKQKFVKNGALIVKNGYCLKMGRVYEWLPANNPPFYTLMFSREEFTDPKEYLKRWGSFRSHEDIPKINKTRKLPDNLYLVVMHETNRSTKNPKRRTHPYLGKMINKEILKEFTIT